MEPKILKCGILGLILIAISEFLVAGSIEGTLPQSKPMIMYFYILASILGIGILVYFWYRGKKGHKSARLRQSDLTALDNNFEELAIEEREKQLVKFLNDKNRSMRSSAAITLVKKFEKLTTNFREDQILNLSKNEYSGVRVKVSERLSEEIFDIISENTRNKLIENLASDSDEIVRGCIVNTIRWNIDKLPEKLQNLLLTFAEDDEPQVRLRVADAVYRNFNSLPENLREKIIKKLADDENADVKGKITEAVKKHYQKLPEKIRNEILQDIEFL